MQWPRLMPKKDEAPNSSLQNVDFSRLASPHTEEGNSEATTGASQNPVAIKRSPYYDLYVRNFDHDTPLDGALHNKAVYPKPAQTQDKAGPSYRAGPTPPTPTPQPSTLNLEAQTIDPKSQT